MKHPRLLSALVVITALTIGVGNADAQGRRRGGGGNGGGGPRGGQSAGPVRGGGGSRPIIVAPRVTGVVPYRPYYYPYRPGFSLGFYTGYGLGYPYGYSSFGYPFGYYPGYYPGYGVGYGDPYGYGQGYVAAAPGIAYGGLRIQGAPRDAQVFADGYYVGIVDDFDGTLQHADLTAGPHRIEIRAPGRPAIEVDVRIEPGQTITYHADRP